MKMQSEKEANQLKAGEVRQEDNRIKLRKKWLNFVAEENLFVKWMKIGSDWLGFIHIAHRSNQTHMHHIIAYYKLHIYHKFRNEPTWNCNTCDILQIWPIFYLCHSFHIVQTHRMPNPKLLVIACDCLKQTISFSF